MEADSLKQKMRRLRINCLSQALSLAEAVDVSTNYIRTDSGAVTVHRV